MGIFIPRPGAPEELARDIKLAQSMGEVADEVAQNVRELAPGLFTGGYSEGDYVEAIESGWDIDDRGGFGRVNANDYRSNWIEFGTGAPGPTPAYAPLRTGAEAAGLKIGSSDE
jgi:hypothetical protein